MSYFVRFGLVTLLGTLAVVLAVLVVWPLSQTISKMMFDSGPAWSSFTDRDTPARKIPSVVPITVQVHGRSVQCLRDVSYGGLSCDW